MRVHTHGNISGRTRDAVREPTASYRVQNRMKRKTRWQVPRMHDPARYLSVVFGSFARPVPDESVSMMRAPIDQLFSSIATFHLLCSNIRFNFFFSSLFAAEQF